MQLQQIVNVLEERLGKPVDILNIESAEPFFVHQILSNKRIIVDKDIHRRVQFEVQHRRQYFDMIPFYKLYHRESLKRLEEES